MESDEKWLNYEDEEIEVEIELADVIFDYLITDTLQCLMNIKSGNQVGSEGEQQQANGDFNSKNSLMITE